MEEKFQLSEEQENLIKEKMGVSDITKIRIIFEVDSLNTEGVSEIYTNKSTKLSVTLCPCEDGTWSWLCCF